MEIVVLDNASGDGSVEAVRDRFPDVAVVAEDRRRGFGANQNRALTVTSGELLYLLNPDTIVHDGTLDGLAAALSREPDVVAAGGPTHNADGSLRMGRPEAQRTAGWSWRKATGLDRISAGEPWDDRVFAEGFLSGGAFLVRRDAFEAVGGFDEGFFMYAEDADLFERLAYAGGRFAWVADAGVTHPFPSEAGELSERRATEMVRGDLRYARKHFPPLQRALFRAGIGFDAAVRLALLRLPRGSTVVQLHGTSIDDQRRRYRNRLKATVLPRRRPGMSELADEWNRAGTS